MEEKKLNERGKEVISNMAKLTVDLASLEIEFDEFFEDNDAE